jgi:phosphohistidine phosphatase SixA
MQIYVYRHALADFQKGHENPPLTEEGRKQVAKVVSHAERFGFKPTQIVSSPLARAKETAELAFKVLKLDHEPSEDECLFGDKQPSEVYSFLKNFKKSDKVMLVSHQPLINELIADLILSDKEKIQMLNGAIAAIEIKKSKPARGSGTLLWLAPPTMI